MTKRISSILIFFVLISTQTFATSITTTFAVTAVVINQCIVGATTMAFGNYDPTVNTDTAASNTLSVTCTSGNAFAIALNAGSTSGGTIGQRKLTDGNTNTLNYNIYSNSSHTTLWGNGTTGTTVTGTGTGAAQTFTGYGLIPKAQAIPSGSYSDLITATLTF